VLLLEVRSKQPSLHLRIQEERKAKQVEQQQEQTEQEPEEQEPEEQVRS
jgi:hypothetical protein